MAAKEDKDDSREDELRHRGWKAMPYVIGNETFEKLGTVGTSSNLVVYLTTVFHMRSVSAATLINVWNGTTNIATLFGAFLADAYLGRYKILGFACIASFLGMIMLTLTAAVSDLHPDKCGDDKPCTGPTQWQFAFLLGGLGFLVVGAGGIRPCNLAFGADQFDPKTESGKRGINSFFNWYFFTFTIAMMLSATLIIYVQSNISWSIGLAIPAALMFLSCSSFYLGSVARIYVKVKPEGSPFTSVVQVVVASIRKRSRELGGATTLFNPPLESKLISKLPHTDQFRVLDKAAIVDDEDEINPNGSASNPWRLCSLQQIEEVKCLIRVIPIWSAGIIFYVSVVQQTTYVVFQALQSDRRLGAGNGFLVPAGSFVVFTMLALTIWIPIYDRIIVPWLRKTTRNKEEGITLLQRMGIGILLSILTMIISGLVEERRRSMAVKGMVIGKAESGGAISAMSSMWLIPQLLVSGLSEAFALIAQVEFFYKQFPEHMRSAAGALLFCGAAMSNYLSGLMVSVLHRTTGGKAAGGGEGGNWLAEDLNNGRLDYFYYLIAAMGVVNFVYFLVCSSWYRYKGTDGEKNGVELINAKDSAPV